MLNESLFHVVGKWHENQIFVLSKTQNYKRYIPDRIMLKAATVLSFESVSTHETAEEAIKIWKIRPNVVNRRLCGSAEIWTANADGARIDIVDDLFGKLKEQYPQLSLKDTNELRTVLGVKSNEDDAFLYSKVAQSNCLSRSDVVVDETCTVDGSGACTLSNIPRKDIPTADRINHIVLRKLLPRSLVKFRTTVEIVAKTENLDSASETTWFIPIFTVNGDELASRLLSTFTYGIRYTQIAEKIGRIELLVADSFHSGVIPSGTLCASLDWLKATLLPKLKIWAETFKTEDVNLAQEKLHSLALVDIEEYTKIYNEMKSKYAEPLIKSWQENTDPQKFVFEDISIASYLMVLWEKERRDEKYQRKQSFVDLGCGNGLLVYLLTNEGIDSGAGCWFSLAMRNLFSYVPSKEEQHKQLWETEDYELVSGYRGQGIDIRKRKIWDSYGGNVKLLERPLHPNRCKFDDIDWIIGNHSDELTPWIPVITARSSYNTKYFLIPCCFHDFTGKFTKNCHDASQYQTYLEYVQQIGEECGFIVEQDIQRIPSTKRNCHIARKRTYSATEHGMIDSRIEHFLAAKNCRLSLADKCTDYQSQTVDPPIELSSNGDGNQFLSREAKEKVRNCTQIDVNVKSSIIGRIFAKLLKCEVCFGGDEDSVTSKGYPIATWNTGGKLSIQEAISLIDKDHLHELKSQCGGLQTLLKNHGHIFEVLKGGVMLRNYRTQQRRKGKKWKQNLQAKQGCNLKTKLCWFHFNHPQGCIMQASDCNFAHSEAELEYLKGNGNEA